MTRMLDASDARIRTEVYELLRDYPQLTADALADRFETTSQIRTFSDPEQPVRLSSPHRDQRSRVIDGQSLVRDVDPKLAASPAP